MWAFTRRLLVGAMLPLAALAGHGVAGHVGGLARDVAVIVDDAASDREAEWEAMRRLTEFATKRDAAREAGDREEFERMSALFHKEEGRVRSMRR